MGYACSNYPNYQGFVIGTFADTSNVWWSSDWKKIANNFWHTGLNLIFIKDRPKTNTLAYYFALNKKD